MKRTCLFAFAAVLVARAATAGQSIGLDFSASCNWDGYISRAERLEAVSYNPPADWSLSDRMVKTVFGQNYINWNYSNRNYVWQDDAGTGVGLPMDGVVSTGTWTYQLVTARDGEPGDGWANPEYPKGTKPTGLLPLTNNVVRIQRPHSATADVPTATTSLTFVASQQGNYASLNLLMQGEGRREVNIYARYTDGEALLWTGKPPNPSAALDPVTYPTDADLSAAFTGNRQYYNTGSPATQNIGTGAAIMWHFVTGRSLDPKRTLVGLKVRMTPVAYASGDFVVYAVSAVPAPSSKGTVIQVR